MIMNINRRYINALYNIIKIIENTFLNKLSKHDDPSFKVKSNLNETKIATLHATSRRFCCCSFVSFWSWCKNLFSLALFLSLSVRPVYLWHTYIRTLIHTVHFFKHAFFVNLDWFVILHMRNMQHLFKEKGKRYENVYTTCIHKKPETDRCFFYADSHKAFSYLCFIHNSLDEMNW